MKIRGRLPIATLLLGLAILVLLPLLAFLQYRWLGQISDAEDQKMLEILKKDTDQFCRNFDLEVTRAFMTFAIGAGSTGEQKGKEYALGYGRWVATSKFPGAVRAIYDVEFRDSQAVLCRFDLTSGRLDPSAWPSSLESVRDTVSVTAGPGQPAADVMSPYRLDPGAGPALIVPRSVPAIGGGRVFAYAAEMQTGDRRPASKEGFPEIPPNLEGTLMGAQSNGSHGFTIVVFDDQYLTEEFIPRLAERFFAGPTRSDYSVTVLQAEGDRKIYYRSDPAMESTNPSKGDVVEKMFEVRFDELADIFATDGTLPPGHASTTIVRSTELLPLSGESAGSAGSRTPSASAQSALIGKATGDGAWIAVVKHKAGSLEAAVTATRRKNLAISFGVLILLAASMGMMLTWTHRARRLAGQQVEFVAGVSHEFRTPLAVICSAGENLADGVIESPEQVRAYGKLIESEGKRLTDMMEQVLQFAGVHRGFHAPEARPVDAVVIIDRALAAYHSAIADGQFKVDKQMDGSLPRVLADPDALERSIQNLLSNAIKYAGPVRWIGVFARMADGPKPEVEITVQDKGIGIPSGELSRIFKPFYRGKQAMAAQIHGNGLGLSLVKHFIEAFGGRVTATSSLERGSSFTLHLPVAPSALSEPFESRGGQDPSRETAPTM
jgi:signal transduction histidine kinase